MFDKYCKQDQQSTILMLSRNNPSVVLGRFTNYQHKCNIIAIVTNGIPVLRTDSDSMGYYMDRNTVRFCYMININNTQMFGMEEKIYKKLTGDNYPAYDYKSNTAYYRTKNNKDIVGSQGSACKGITKEYIPMSSIYQGANIFAITSKYFCNNAIKISGVIFNNTDLHNYYKYIKKPTSKFLEPQYINRDVTNVAKIQSDINGKKLKSRVENDDIHNLFIDQIKKLSGSNAVRVTHFEIDNKLDNELFDLKYNLVCNKSVFGMNPTIRELEHTFNFGTFKVYLTINKTRIVDVDIYTNCKNDNVIAAIHNHAQILVNFRKGKTIPDYSIGAFDLDGEYYNQTWQVMNWISNELKL